MTRSSEDRERAGLEAARWLVELEEKPDDAALRRRFEAWMRASPDNATAWADTSAVYDLLERIPPAHEGQWRPRGTASRPGAETVPAGTEAPRRRVVARRLPQRVTSRRLALGLAASALAAGLALAVTPSLLLRIESDHLTSTGQQRSVRLSDGTTVRLAPASAIAVDFDADGRRVRLLSGEAFFEVTSDATRPFSVDSHDVVTTVLGTAFDVRLGEDAATVAVRHGQVRVDNTVVQPPVSARLAAGDWLRVDRDGQVRSGQTPPDEVGAWLQGQIVARDRPLEDVVADLRRYYAGLIVLTESAFGKQQITGVYNVADPVAALSAMAGAHGGAVHQISPWLLVVTGS